MKPRLSISTCDMIRAEDPLGSVWARILAGHYDLIAAPVDQADLVIYSDWGHEHWRARGRKIYYSGENMEPDYNQCDFAITPCLREGDPRHFRWPYYAQGIADPGVLVKSPGFDAEAVLRSKPKFCCFVASNPRAPERNRFFKLLNRRKRVDSGGRHFNNVGQVVRDKLVFAREYKFVIAFENSLSRGYTTEKIVDAMLAGGIPIYWGNPEVARDFNPKSFINAHDFPSLEAVVERVLELDSDEARYLRILREPWFHANTPPDVFGLDAVRAAFFRFIESGEGPAPRIYRKRRLREHAYSSGVAQTFMSARCRLESALWKIGLRF